VSGWVGISVNSGNSVSVFSWQCVNSFIARLWV